MGSSDSSLDSRRKRKRRTTSEKQDSECSSSRNRARRRGDSRKRKRHRSKRRDRRRRGSDSDSIISESSENSSSDDSSYEKRQRRRRKERKGKKKRKKDHKRKKKSKKDALPSVVHVDAKITENIDKKDPSVLASNNVRLQEDEEEMARRQKKAKSMVPMSREQYDKEQSIIREVYDEESGRYRLVRGNGEIIERIVSQGEHARINQTATRGDGASFARHVFDASRRR